MTFSGFWKAKIAIRIILFRVEVDDQLLLDVLWDVCSLREVEEGAGEFVGVPLEPRVACGAVGCEGIGYDLEGLAFLAYTYFLSGFDSEGGDVYDAAVDDDVLVADELSRSGACWCYAESVDDVVEARFEDCEEDFAGDAFGALSVGVGDAELAFEDSVGVFSLLFLFELLAVLGEFASAVLSVLSRGIVAVFEILVWTEDGFAEFACDLGSWACVPCHCLFFDLSILILNDEYGSL